MWFDHIPTEFSNVGVGARSRHISVEFVSLVKSLPLIGSKHCLSYEGVLRCALVIEEVDFGGMRSWTWIFRFKC